MDSMRIGRLDKMVYCPKCKARQDGYAGEGKPENGDLTICGYCLSINKYIISSNGDMSLVSLNEKEIEEVKEKEPGLWDAIQNSISLAKKVLLHKQKDLN